MRIENYKMECYNQKKAFCQRGPKMTFFPYGKEKLGFDFDGYRLKDTVYSSIETFDPAKSEEELIEEAMEHPIASAKLRDLSKGKKNVVIIASDHTRPVPSKQIIPKMLAEIRSGSPDADITILIATGCHRGTTEEELVSKFGEAIVRKEKIVVHDCDDSENLVKIGVLPSGSECVINKLAMNADLLVAEGFIEPHFFAGFSGGRKSVLPGISGRKTVLANHCSEFIANEYARTGILEHNPIHTDMLWAAKAAKLAYIVNVVLGSEKKVIGAFAGDPEKAHLKGCEFLTSLCEVKKQTADVVITTNGGYPLDQNVYQSVKGMTAAEGMVKENGVIIMLSKANDGVGGDAFLHQLADHDNIDETLDLFLRIGRTETVPDQWQTQILIRVLKKATVIYVSEMDDKTVESIHMIPAHSIEEALGKAKQILQNDDPEIIAIPDGVSVVVK